MPKKERTTISLPQKMIEEIDKLWPEFGYESRAEFVRDAVRRLIRELKMELEKRK